MPPRQIGHGWRQCRRLAAQEANQYSRNMKINREHSASLSGATPNSFSSRVSRARSAKRVRSLSGFAVVAKNSSASPIASLSLSGLHWNFITQSRLALGDGDLERAYNLATKANLLSQELAK